MSPKTSRRVDSRKVKNIVSAADHAAMHEHYSFLPPESNKKHNVDDGNSKNQPIPGVSSWQDRMVAQYHQHLFREFALADLSVPGRIGLRWRTKEEVFSGRGERSCGNKRCRNNSDGADDLATLEVPFSYEEHGERKKELVKLRVCKKCRPLLNHSTANEDSQSGVTPGENELEEDEDFGGNSPESAKKKRRKSKHSKRRYKYENKRRRRDKT